MIDTAVLVILSAILAGSLVLNISLYIMNKIPSKSIQIQQDLAKSQKELTKSYDDLAHNKTSLINSLKGKLSRQENPQINDGEGIDEILSNLPGKWKLLIAPFKDNIKEFASKNPDMIKEAIAAIAKKQGAGGEESQSQSLGDFL